jgi:hypothetical protein
LPAFDASSIIYAWEYYPPENFPPLWQWMGKQINQSNFVVPKVAFEEVANKIPECAQWLSEHDIQKIEITDDIIQEAMRIKDLLEISEDNYRAGVGENDLLIIATASVHGFELITNEALQTSLPKILANRKIPAVCNMDNIRVPCMDFLALIKQSNEVFG